MDLAEEVEPAEPAEPPVQAAAPVPIQEGLDFSAEEPVEPDEGADQPEPDEGADQPEPDEGADQLEVADQLETAPADQPEVEAPVEPADETDDVAAAIAAAGANIDEGQEAGDGETGSSASSESLSVPVAVTVSSAPFLIYDLLWMVFAGLLVWQFSELPRAQAVFESNLYPLAVIGGTVLAAVGPLLIFAVWFGSWGREGARKGALFVSSLFKGSVATIIGVALWWGALVLLDQLRLGRLL
jgi:hypothetical protein